MPPNSATGAGIHGTTWTPTTAVSTSSPAIKGTVVPLLAPPPEYAKTQLQSINKPSDVKKFRAVWRYHSDHGGTLDDWVSFIPKAMHPAIQELLRQCVDDNAGQVYLDEQIANWKKWSVFDLLDAILLAIDPVPVQVNAEEDALKAARMPNSQVFSADFVATLVQNFTEELLKRKLDYETVSETPNDTLVEALEEKIKQLGGEAQENLRSKLRAVTGGRIPNTIAAYLRTLSTIIRQYLSHRTKADAMIGGRTSTVPYGAGSSSRNRSPSVNAVTQRREDSRDRKDHRADRDPLPQPGKNPAVQVVEMHPIRHGIVSTATQSGITGTVATIIRVSSARLIKNSSTHNAFDGAMLHLNPILIRPHCRKPNTPKGPTPIASAEMASRSQTATVIAQVATTAVATAIETDPDR